MPYEHDIYWNAVFKEFCLYIFMVLYILMGLCFLLGTSYLYFVLILVHS